MTKLRPYLIVFFGSILISVVLSTTFRTITDSFTMNPWLIFNLLLEGVAALALFTFQKSPRRVFEIQILLGILVRTVNLVKVHYLNLPIIPSDFFLLDEVTQIVPVYASISVLLGAVCILTYLFVRAKKGYRQPQRWQWLAVAPFSSFLAWLFLFPSSYAATFDTLIKNEIFGIPFLLKERSQTMGMMFSFTIDLSKYLEIQYKRPTRAEVTTLLTQLPKVTKEEVGIPNKSNIYIILAESFWDPTNMLASKKSLLDSRFGKIWSENGSRHFLSPTFGGGTANVEFEILCGIPARSTGRGIVFQGALSNSMECLPKILKNLGYETLAFHSFEGSFYNRTTAFPKIGFDHFFSLKDFISDPKPGDFISDRMLISESIRMARAKANGKPFLAYMMTFAAHWPYAWLSSYDQEYSEKIELPDKDDSSDWTAIERYLNVNRITSKILAGAVDEITKNDPSAIIVIAGDHLPGLASDLILGASSEDVKDWQLYRTPLLIIDPSNKSWSHAEADTPAYTIPHEILSRIGIPNEAQAHLPLFTPPPTLVVRGVQNGATFVNNKNETNRTFYLCNPQLNTAVCKETISWLKQIHPLALDLVLGSQYTYDSIRAPASEKPIPQ